MSDFKAPGAFCCILCHRDSHDGVVRVNEYGGDAVWACLEHRKLFPRALQPTDEALTLAVELKRRLYS